MRALLAAATLLVAAACDAGFASKEIVVDLRILAMRAEPPELVVDVDPDDPLGAVDDLGPVTLTALVADPGSDRSLSWRLRACPPTDNHFCDGSTAPVVDIASGLVADGIEGTFTPSIELLRASLEADPRLGFGGIVVVTELAIAPTGSDFARAELAKKRVVVSSRIPAERVANDNPRLTGLVIDGTVTDTDAGCASTPGIPVAAGSSIKLEPQVTDDSRQDYLLPTFDGDVLSLTEYMRHAWYVTAGSLSPATTGGPIDAFGNIPPLHAEYTAPATAGPVDLWLVTRDERGGATWTRRCLRVAP